MDFVYTISPAVLVNEQLASLSFELCRCDFEKGSIMMRIGGVDSFPSVPTE
jgi:hypothetical protein